MPAAAWVYLRVFLGIPARLLGVFLTVPQRVRSPSWTETSENRR